MKKQIIVVLFIVNTAFVHAMSKSISCLSRDSSLKSLCFSCDVPNESKLISDLRICKDQFEKSLKLDTRIEWQKTYSLVVTSPLFSFEKINTVPALFLRYCYYQKFHKTEFSMNLEILKNNLALLSKCRRARVSFYSAVGAAMLAPDIPLYARYNFVQQLINLDFCSTPKDREIAELILYDEIMKNKQKSEFKKKLIHLLHPDSPAHWHILPQDIRKLIAQYLVEVIKTDNNYWLLPDGKKDLVVMY